MKWPSLVRYWFVSGLGDGEVALVRQLVDVEDAGARDRHAHRPQPGRHQRDVDDGADAGALALEQGGADATGERHARLQVAEAGAGHRRRELLPGRRDADGRARATPVRDAVEATLAGERATWPLRRAPAVHDPRVAARSRPRARCRAWSRAAGRRLVTNTSAVSTSDIRMSRPSSVLMSRPSARLPRLPTSKRCDTPLTRAGTPQAATWRTGSPHDGCSIFSTSAPQSARMAADAGTNTKLATSSTRTPSNGPGTLLPLLVATPRDQLIMMIMAAPATRRQPAPRRNHPEESRLISHEELTSRASARRTVP